MFPILIELGPITLHTYGLLVAIGFLTAYKLAEREFERKGFLSTILDRLVLLTLVGGIIGARLVYALTSDPHYFLENPLTFFRVWEGGLVYYGGFILSLVFIFIYCRKQKIAPLLIFDVIVPSLLIGHAIGRLGCFAAGCCYGQPTESWVGVTFTHAKSLAPQYVSLLPTQIYSSLGNFALFLGAWWLSKNSKKIGVLSTYYLLSYGTFRFLIEFIRNDLRGQVVGGLHPSQWISLFLISVGIFLFFHLKNKKS